MSDQREMRKYHQYCIDLREELLRALDQILDASRPELAPGYMVINEKIRALDSTIKAFEKSTMRVVK